MQAASGRFPPQQLIEMLDLELSVNGEAVVDLSFYTAGEAASAVSGDSSNSKRRKRMRARFIETPTGELRRYLGRDVRVLMAGHEKPESGILVAANGEEANVEKRVLKGKMTLHVPYDDIVRIEVMRFPETPE